MLPLRALVMPRETCRQLSSSEPGALTILFRYAIWLLLMPPVFAWLGAYQFGWRLGADEPLMLPASSLALISAGYFAALVFGFVSTALISQWMATTYGANRHLGRHFAFVTMVGAPLAFASLAHLFPHVFLNVVILIPAMMWSMYLLYSGIATVLETVPERGMLMASALVGWLLVAAVSLLGLSMWLWVAGIGPSLGV
ncbi:Yip1 family protein [Pseudohongiella sp. SYSU M77423]|uniref:Yip1 family protein n=1 Tax=unclassified Pseudohongiella TaxID=2629611 RepID=UPI001F01BCC3|nr:MULTISPECIES: Yip1 family protein [unclassified Pseudohongiella]MDH7943568.1 Yip1 family protein [Pseudohongiella sp. SYSU M77423]